MLDHYVKGSLLKIKFTRKKMSNLKVRCTGCTSVQNYLTRNILFSSSAVHSLTYKQKIRLEYGKIRNE